MDDSKVAPPDPALLAQAAEEVDESLLEWSLSLSLRERLRACSNAARALTRFQGDETSSR